MKYIRRSAAMMLLLWCMIVGSPALLGAEGYTVGSTAKDFSLKNVDGTMIALKNLPNAKGAIVVFTCNHCPFAKAYEERIIALHKAFAPKGFPVVAINPNDTKAQPEDSFEQMVKRAKEKQYPFPYVLDETQEIAKTYGATRTPHVFVLKKMGEKFEVVYIGAIDDNTEDAKAAKEKYVESAIAAVLANQAPAVTSTKAIGCTIKWKK
jgi:peroxiredoxin